MDKMVLIQLAAQAGFGANQRTTLLVKLTRFANLILEHRNESLHQPTTGAEPKGD